MNINKPTSGEYKYIIHIQNGPIAMRGTWFCQDQFLVMAYENFLDQIERHQSIAIFDDDAGGIYVKIGAGTIITFMTEKMAESIEIKQRLIKQ